MTDKPVHGGAKTSVPDSAEKDVSAPESPNTGVVSIGGSISIRQSAVGPGAQVNVFTPETVALVSAVVIFSKAFLETLGQHAGDAAAGLPKRMRHLVRSRIRRDGGPDEYHVGLASGASAVVVVTEELPDEARLALLDLDVTAEELRGKLLRWDSAAAVWCPSDALPAEPGGSAPAEPS